MHETPSRGNRAGAGSIPAPILLVTPWFPPTSGGVSEVAERLRRGLIQAGVETHLLIGHDGSRGRGLIPHPSLGDVHYVTVPGAMLARLTMRAIAGGMLYGIPLLVRLRRYMRDRRIGSVVLIYPIEFVWPFLLMKRLQGVRLIVSLHGNDVERYQHYPPRSRWLLRTVLGHADAITVCAPHLREAARAIQPSAAAPIHLIANGVDPTHFTPPPPEFDRRDGRPTLLHISNFAPKKRTPDIIEAFASPEVPGDARLVMVGEGPDLPIARRRAHELGIQDRVDFVGMKKDVRPFFWQADAFVLASAAEGAPLVLLEAMACGVPWISTPWGAAADLPPGECGLVVPPGEPVQLGNAMAEMLRHPETRSEMARRCRERVVAEYSSQMYIDQHLKLLRGTESEY
jgi:L-malate glycosyltransferase